MFDVLLRERWRERDRDLRQEAQIRYGKRQEDKRHDTHTRPQKKYVYKKPKKPKTNDNVADKDKAKKPKKKQPKRNDKVADKAKNNSEPTPPTIPCKIAGCSLEYQYPSAANAHMINKHSVAQGSDDLYPITKKQVWCVVRCGEVWVVACLCGCINPPRASHIHIYVGTVSVP